MTLEKLNLNNSHTILRQPIRHYLRIVRNSGKLKLFNLFVTNLRTMRYVELKDFKNCYGRNHAN